MNTETQSRSRLGILAVLSTITVFVLSGGLPGIAAGGLIAVCWYFLPAVYVYAIGHFALLVTIPTTDIVLFGLAETTLIGILVAPIVQTPRPRQRLLLTIAGIMIGVVVSWASYQQLNHVWTAGFVLIGAWALLTYGLHRYEQLALGLIEDTTPTENYE